MIPTIRLHPGDSVLIARSTLMENTDVAPGVRTTMRIPAGHKVAIKPIAPGEAIIRYGQIIGFATQPIAPGSQVHVHNCGMGDFDKDYAYTVDARPTAMANEQRNFMGFRAPTAVSPHATTSASSHR